MKRSRFSEEQIIAVLHEGAGERRSARSAGSMGSLSRRSIAGAASTAACS